MSNYGRLGTQWFAVHFSTPPICFLMQLQLRMTKYSQRVYYLLTGSAPYSELVHVPRSALLDLGLSHFPHCIYISISLKWRGQYTWLLKFHDGIKMATYVGCGLNQSTPTHMKKVEAHEKPSRRCGWGCCSKAPETSPGVKVIYYLLLFICCLPLKGRMPRISQSLKGGIGTFYFS